MDLFKTAVISLFVIALIAVISVSVTAHPPANYNKDQTTDSRFNDNFFDEMKEIHEAMHPGTNFEEFHEEMFGENWKEKIQGMHKSLNTENFEEMQEHCPMMPENYSEKETNGMHKGMEGMHKSMQGMMH